MTDAKIYIHDPQARLDYSIDWTDWLSAGETISSFDFLVPPGITHVSQSVASGKITVWLESGEPGRTYTVIGTIWTNQGRTDERSFMVRVRQR